MTDINLLPEDFAKGAPVAKIAAIFTKIAIVLFVLTLLVSSGATAYVMYNSYGIKISEQKQEQYRNTIKNLEGSEQKVVFMKDRAGRIDRIMKNDRSAVYLDRIAEIYSGVPVDSSISSLVLDKNTIEVDYTFKNSTDLQNFLTSVQTMNKNYKEVTTGAFSYSEDGSINTAITYIP